MATTVTTWALPGTSPRVPAIPDVVMAVAALGASTVLLLHQADLSPASTHDLGPAGVALLLGATAPLVVARRFPAGVTVATGVASVTLALLGTPISLAPGLSGALYLLAARRRRGAPGWRKGLLVAAVPATYLAVVAVSQQAVLWTWMLHTCGAWSVSWLAGERSRLRREQLDELRGRARRAEREAERERELAVARERTRIARDLHDSAGHAMSLIAVRAGAARLRHPQDPARSLDALSAIEELARQTVTEIDQIVGTLRERAPDDGAVDAPPGLGSVDMLVAQHTAAGLRVTRGTAGTPRALSGAVDQAAYRILQQALSNAARHGAGSAHVVLTFTGSALDVEVTNPLRPGAPQPGGGHGLVGMRERATMLGGTLWHERAEGHFRVRARLPYGGHRS